MHVQRVKEVLPPHLIDHRNNEKQTAEGFFATTQKALWETSVEWLKRTSEGCSVVAILIATVAFAAAYTVPGGPESICNELVKIPANFDEKYHFYYFSYPIF
jgi:hypothetical protein